MNLVKNNNPFRPNEAGNIKLFTMRKLRKIIIQVFGNRALNDFLKTDETSPALMDG